MDWNEDLINQIRADKEKERSEDRDNLLALTSHSLYGEKIHYALELIQNAEDEKSEAIIFIFDNNDVIVVNDGKSFDRKDVWRICSVKSGGKKKKIGFFGIGFKSVFNITKAPRIISGEFNFEIEGYVYPKALKSLPENIKKYYKPEKGAIFVLPYYSDLSTPTELIENFNLIDEKIPLFLNLKELRFIDKIHNNEWSIKKEPKDNLVVLQNTRTEQETKWRVFSKDLHVDSPQIVPKGKEGIEDTRITIAFPVERDIRDSIKKSGVAYCYLPTKKRTDLSFLIQADFLPTIGRENISEHVWNTWLMEELGDRASIAIDEMKGDDTFVNFLYEFIPLEEEIQDDIIKPLYRSFRKGIGEKEIAKTTNGWIMSDNCMIPEDDRIRGILTENDLKLLFGEEMFYVVADASERDKRVLLELGAKKVGIKEVVDFLKKEDEVKSKNSGWFLDVYDYLSSVFDISETGQWDENTRLLFEEAQNSKFILSDDEKLVSLKDPAKPDRLICYPQSINLSEIHQIFTEDEIVFLNRYFQESTIAHRKEDDNEEKRKRVKAWFNSVGVRQYFKQVHVIQDAILPKFTTGKYKQYDDLKLYKLTDYIRTYWSTIESEINNKKISSDIIKEIRISLLLKSFSYKDGNRVEEYRKPEDIYFSQRYGRNEVMEDLFERIEGVNFLSPYYLNREKRGEKKKNRGRQKTEYTWRKFFEVLGIWSSPRVLKDENWVSISSKKQYGWVKKEYSARGIHEIYGDSYSKDVEVLIEYCSKIGDQAESKKRMILLWESLAGSWKSYKEKEYCSIRYKWFDRTEYYKDYATSSFLEFLRSAKWIPTDDAGFCTPSEPFMDTKKNRLLIGDDAKYVFLKASEVFFKDLEIKIEPTIEVVLNHLKGYKERNRQPDENIIDKMNEIYAFLQSKVNSIENTEEKEKKIQEIRNIFNEFELLYLPREDKAWWKPCDVFWKDFSDDFEILRGYVEHEGEAVYDSSLKEFFFLLGLLEEPLVRGCLALLEELKTEGDLGCYKRLSSKIYTYIDSFVKRRVKEEADWNKAIFLSENDKFPCPSELYFSDNNEYKESFREKIEILWLPFSWINCRHMLQIAGFKGLSHNICAIKKFDDLREIEGDISKQLIQRLLYVENYLKKKNSGLYWEIEKEGLFKKIQELQVYETSKITLDYSLIKDNSEQVIIGGIEKEAYFSNDEGRLYKTSQVSLFSTSVAKEISRLFGIGEEETFPVLDSLFSADNEEALDEKLRYFGIQIDDNTEEIREKVKLKEKKPQQPEIVAEKKEVEPQEEKGEKPQLPSPEPKPKESELVDPDEFIFDSIEKHSPYAKVDGASNIPAKEVKLRDGNLGNIERNKPSKDRATRTDAEGIALEMVMRFEEMEDRLPEDRHNQRKIGYDIFSKTKDDEELFIEVKHFREDTGAWELDHYQWKKAEQEGDKFFVYVVSGLKKGLPPKIQILRNPVKYLVPDPPYKKSFSDWKNGIVKVVKCQKV